MKGFKAGETLLLSTKIKRSRKWKEEKLVVVAVYEGKDFITVSNGLYRDTLDLWSLKQEIKEGKAKLERLS